MTRAVLAFALAGALLAVLPGPDSLLVLRAILLRGRRCALTTALGILTGLTVWVGAAALGLSALLRASHAGYTVLRVLGGLYLVLLGIQAWRSRPEPGPRVGVLGVGYRAGLVTNLLNPKVGVFFISLLPGFVPAGQPVGPASLLLGLVFVAEGATYFAVIVVLAERLGRLLERPIVRRRLDRLTGTVLVGFGLRLAVER